MTDYFALLDELWRPWLDPDVLHKKYLEQSSRVHPDRFHGAAEPRKREAHDQYTELNAAFQCLREPKSRLLHLLTLEQGKPPPEVMSIPHETTDLFLEVGALCREADQFLSNRAEVTSPLLQVAWFEQGQDWGDRLRGLKEKVDHWQDSMLDTLKNLNGIWIAAPPPGHRERLSALPLQKLEQIYRLLSYGTRWSGQLQERAFQLTV